MRATQRARTLGRRVSNVVFMGMGEPLANYDRTWEATLRLHDDLGLSARHLTISTVGIVPGIRRLAAESLPVNLAVSLHAANDALRDELVPINRRYPLEDIIAACRGVDRGAQSASLVRVGADRRRSTIARRTRAELAEIARPLRAHVNLIPLNPTPGWPTRGTPRARVLEFRDRLKALGVNATVRAESRHRDRRSMRTACCGGQPTCDVAAGPERAPAARA